MIAGPMDRRGKLHALLSTARVANIPSVVSNVWLGVAVGLIYGYGENGFPDLLPAGYLMAAGVLLYAGGNFLNDWMDRGWDQTHRPERALPQGVFTPALYLCVAIAMITGGLGFAALAGWQCALVAGVIGVFIVIYTIWHKRGPWAVVPMGICRALLPVMGFVAFHPQLERIWPMACGVFCYIVGLSLTARHESMAEPPKLTGLTARFLLLATAVLMAWGNKEMFLHPAFVIAGALPYLAWTSVCLRYWRKPLPRFVSGLLAGIPLVDWMTLLPLSATTFLRVSDGTLEVAAGLVIPPLAFVSALLLQRLAPAT